jgi:uncharacterized protein YceK
MRINLIVLSAACLLAGCATAYQPDGVSGGYSAQMRDGNMVQVSFRANGLTTPETLQSYVLRRCAEVTLQDGFNYFVLLRTEAPIEGSDKIYSMKVATATIKMVQGNKTENDPHTYNATYLLKQALADQGESEEPTSPPAVASADNANTKIASSAPARLAIANPNPNALTNEGVHFDHW